MSRRWLPVLCLLIAAAAGAPQRAQAQNAPEYPGLRGITEMRYYIGFTGRAAALTACGITPEVESSLYDMIRQMTENAGLRNRHTGFERVSPSDNSHVLVGQPRELSLPSLGYSVVVLAAQQGGQSACALSTDVQVRSRVSGALIGATGLTYEGPLLLWYTDEVDLVFGSGRGSAELRTSIEDATRGFIAAWSAANGRPVAPAGASPQAPPMSPPANPPRTGGSKG